MLHYHNEKKRKEEEQKKKPVEEAVEKCLQEQEVKVPSWGFAILPPKPLLYCNFRNYCSTFHVNFEQTILEKMDNDGDRYCVYRKIYIF